MLAYECALSVYSFQSHVGEYSELLRTVAKVAHAENDLSRAIDLYVEIFDAYKNSTKDRTNEVRGIFCC